MTPALTLAQAARIMREATRDKSYQRTEIGQAVAAYLMAKRKRLTPSSQRGYESTLDKLARHFPDLRVEDFEPPAGTQRLEEFLDDRWGASAPGTYNVCLAHVTDFFRYLQLRERLHGNPTLAIERARTRDTRRTVFTTDERHALLAAASEQRDRIALRLLFDAGLRKGALRGIQFRDFDWQRRSVTIQTKGEKVRTVQLPDAALWTELERLTLDLEAKPTYYLMHVIKPIPRAGVRRFPAKQMSSTAMQRWWEKRWSDAGYEYSATREMNMHQARHTFGQRVLDGSHGDLKLVQRALGHASIQTTGDIYVDYDNATIAAKLADALGEDG